MTAEDYESSNSVLCRLALLRGLHRGRLRCRADHPALRSKCGLGRQLVVAAAARFDCLKSGECVAVPMGQPEDLGAIKQGFPRLGFTYEAGADLIFNVDMTRRAWGEKNQGTLVRFARAFAASYEYMNDP